MNLKAVKELLNKFFPDWRRVLNELQRYSASGQIDAGVLVNLSENNLNELYGHLKDKNITEVRRWIVNNLIMTQYIFFVGFTIPFMIIWIVSTIPHAVVILGEYQFKSYYVADQEINLLAFFTELMGR